jgi:hypothetical protein
VRETTTRGQCWQLAGTTAAYLPETGADRRIEDHLTDMTGRFTGRATFRQDAAEISYTERGELRFGAHAEHWHARGPAKDYATATTYTRIGT